MKIYFLLNIILSTILFNLAYLCPDYMGFTILFFWIPVFFIVEKLSNKKIAFLAGFLWGVGTYSIHFIWFFILLKAKAYTTFFEVFFIYFFIVLVFALTSGILFLILFLIRYFILKIDLRKKTVLYLFIFIFTWWFYLTFLSNYFFKILDKNIKYPFILPTVPLASFKLFLKLLAFIYLPLNNQNQISFTKLEEFKKQIFYLQPDNDLGYKYSQDVAIDRIYCKIMNLKKQNSLSKVNKISFFLMPESAFPFVLNTSKLNELKFKKALENKDNLLLGGFHKKKGKTYQSIYLIRKGRITQIYDKTILVPGVEKLPKFWRKHFNFVQKLFLKDKTILSKGKKQNYFFELMNDFKIIPKVCSEFFWQDEKTFKMDDIVAPKIILAFINDSWFCSYFKKLMQNYAKIRAVEAGILVVYIGFDNIMFFD